MTGGKDRRLALRVCGYILATGSLAIVTLVTKALHPIIGFVRSLLCRCRLHKR